MISRVKSVLISDLERQTAASSLLVLSKVLIISLHPRECCRRQSLNSLDPFIIMKMLSQEWFLFKDKCLPIGEYLCQCTAVPHCECALQQIYHCHILLHLFVFMRSL